jgi:DNA (cytosine-5)-methyltransferase 1
VFAADWDHYACETYRRNLGSHVHEIDLAAVSPRKFAEWVAAEAGPIDVVAGGPPCQGFSVQRRGNPADHRNDLLVQFARIAAELQPKLILIENVPTILGARGAGHIEEVAKTWSDAGYAMCRSILEAASFGVPQMRRRAFVVGIRKGAPPFHFPEPMLKECEYVTVRDAIGDLPPPPADFGDHPDYANHKRVKISPLNLKRLSYVPEGGGRLDVPAHLQLPCHRSSNGHRHLDVFGRLRWDRPSGTITAMFDNFTRGRFAHPAEDRNITSREGARLQSFPDDFVFVGPKKDVAKQIGNAVSPLLAKAIGIAALNHFENTRLLTQNDSERELAVA